MGWNCCHVPDIFLYLLSPAQQSCTSLTVEEKKVHCLFPSILLPQVISKRRFGQPSTLQEERNENASSLYSTTSFKNSCLRFCTRMPLYFALKLKPFAKKKSCTNTLQLLELRRERKNLDFFLALSFMEACSTWKAWEYQLQNNKRIKVPFWLKSCCSILFSQQEICQCDQVRW